ncbi:MAG TPA: F0F1 ATP synthase subunit delta [Thermomicrobiales bacterium]|nr:F0F1 ATP synthase subunit delta [Thermomicrobiales bacterium]
MATTVARRYAQAVFELARDAKRFDEWERDLGILNAIMSDPVTSSYLQSPKTAQAAKQALLDTAMKDAQPEAQRLAAMLLERRRFSSVPEIFEHYQSLLLEEKGIVIAEVTTAVPLDAEGETMIGKQLSELVGKDVEVRTHVDPAIIGGMVARIGDNLIDGSVSNQLRRLHERLTTSNV